LEVVADVVVTEVVVVVMVVVMVVVVVAMVDDLTPYIPAATVVVFFVAIQSGVPGYHDCSAFRGHV
jgi:hypothetical protein